MKAADTSTTSGGVLLRFPFFLKLALSISLLLVFLTGTSAYYFFREVRISTIEGMGARLRDIGRTGAFLLEEQHRKDLAYLTAQVDLHTRFKATKEQLAALNGEDGEALTDDDGNYESLDPKVSAKIMAGPAFQRVVRALRQIREGSRQKVRPLGPIPALDVLVKKGEDLPTIAYVWMIMPVKSYPSEKHVIYLVDSDYMPVDDDGSGEPYEGNPIGNVTNTLTEEMGLSFRGDAISEKEFLTDQWGYTTITGYIPILGPNKRVLAVLGIDYDVKSEVNKINVLRNVSVSIVVTTFVIALLLSFLLARWLNRPIAILQAGARKVSMRDFTARVNIESKDEFGQLASVFNSMVHEIDSYAKSLESLNAAFERFVPHEFLQQMGQKNIVDVRLGDQAEREMTVLFSDIRSFTSISETMNHKECFDFLNEYLSYVSPLVRSHHGFIDKFIGDAIMALFPRHPDDAIRNAIEMFERLNEFNQKVHARGGTGMKIGVGLHMGSLMLGTIGEEQRMESTVISDAVNIASRLEGLTKRFGVNIVLSEETLQKTENDNLYHRPLGRVLVKGKKISFNVVEIYNVDSEEQIELKNKTKDTFTEALGYFKKGQVREAADAFKEVLSVNPEDKPAKVYCDYMLKKAKLS